MRILLHGSPRAAARGNELREDVRRILNELRHDYPCMSLMCKGNAGAERIARRWAKKHSVPCDVYSRVSRCDENVTREYQLDNVRMVDLCDGIVVLSCGRSKITKHLLAHASGKLMRCVEYE